MYFNLHTHDPSQQQGIISLYNQYPWEPLTAALPFSCGIHPWYIETERLQADLDQMDQWLVLDSCWAIGECGLDNRRPIPLSVQQAVFEAQLERAKIHQKPVVLHMVGAWDLLFQSIKRVNPKVPFVVHGFAKNDTLAHQLVRQGFFLSFGKKLLQNPALTPIFAAVPNDRFLLETDSIDVQIEAVYQQASLAKGIPMESLQLLVKQQWERIFKQTF
jgi:TatD DNase family protein